MAAAHIGHEVRRAERYLKLDVAGRELRLVVSLTLSRKEGLRAREAADEDGSGLISEPEAKRHLAAWGRALASELRVEVDGSVRPLRWGEGYLGPTGRVRPGPLTAELVGRGELEPGVHVVRLVDGMRREQLDRTDVAFRARKGAELIRSGPGPAPEGVTRRLFFGPDAEVHTFTLKVKVPASPATPSRWPTWVGSALAILALAVLALAGAVLALRRRSRSRVR